jgi:feruloyl-CoA synthase
MSDADLHMPKLNQWDNSGRHFFAFTNNEQHTNISAFADLFADRTSLTDEAEVRFQAVTPDTLAKIQFTSGSTNLPKGAEVTHGMMTSNQVCIAQLWPFLGSDDVLVDWLPWNHTFGGNFVTNMALMHGATMHIDNGNPTPAGLDKTIANIIDVQPTIYFGVPASYAALYSRMQQDDALRQAFFKRLKFIFVAAAALDQKTYGGFKVMSKEERGEEVPFFSAWGTTETAPCATLVYWVADDIRVIGLPTPGTTLKLVPDAANRYEIRVSGPNISKGYYRNPQATTVGFDETGFYCPGDAVAFSNPNDPNAGVIFDGRIGEDFKLASGVWAHNAQLRASINKLGQPFLMEVVPAAPNKAYLTALIIPNVAALRGKFSAASATHPDDANFLSSEPVIELFRDVFRQHNASESGSSKRFVRFAILADPLQFDRGETTDKGYINQRAVLTNHAALVEQLYEESPPAHVIHV